MEKTSDISVTWSNAGSSPLSTLLLVGSYLSETV